MRRFRFLLALALIALSASTASAATSLDRLPRVQVSIDAARYLGPLKPLFRDFAQGGESGDPDFMEPVIPAMRALRPRLIRFDGAVSAYTDVRLTPEGELTLDFAKLDAYLDVIAAMGAKALVCVSYTPAALSYDGSDTSPPNDLDRWAEVVRRTVEHVKATRPQAVEFWEVWNEPDLGGFWGATMDEYYRLYAATARAVKAAAPAAKVGGPAWAGFHREWFAAFLDFVIANRLPLDFVSWHNYATQPPVDADNARTMKRWLHQRGLNAEIVLDEWNYDAALTPANDDERAACYAAGRITYAIDSPMDYMPFFEIKDGWDLAVLQNPFWGRWGVFTLEHHAKAVYQQFLAWSMLGPERIALRSSRYGIGGIAATDDNGVVAALIYSYPFETDARATVRFRRVPGRWVRWERLLIDHSHANPAIPGASTELSVVESYLVPVRKGMVEREMVVPKHSVSLVRLTPVAQPPALDLAINAEPSDERHTSAMVTVTASGAPDALHGLADVGLRCDVGWSSERVGHPALIEGGRGLRFTWRATPPANRPDGYAFFTATATVDATQHAVSTCLGREWLLAALGATASSGEEWGRLAELAWSLNRRDEAIDAYRRAVTAPASPEERSRLRSGFVTRLLTVGDRAEALRQFVRVATGIEEEIPRVDAIHFMDRNVTRVATTPGEREWALKAAARATAGLTDPSTRDRMRLDVLAPLYLRLGRREEAAAIYRDIASRALEDGGHGHRALVALQRMGERVDFVQRQGLITGWWLIGPFDNPGGAGFDRVFPPEESIDLGAHYQGKAGQVRWRRYVTDDPMGIVDFMHVFPNDDVVAYAVCWLSAPRDTVAQLRLGSDDSVKVWLDGALVWSHDERRVITLDQDVVSVTIPAGRHPLLVKVTQGVGGWGFALRVTDENGAALRGIRRSPQ